MDFLSLLMNSLWEIVVALFLLCAGMGTLVLVYVWLSWYASVYVETQRERTNAYNNKPGKVSGLSKSEFQKLPTFVCNAQAEQGSNNKSSETKEICISSDLECAVCLDQFMDGESCLVIPTCRHCFHVHCADAWLSQRSVCPLCRGTAEIRNVDQQPPIEKLHSVEINPAEEQGSGPS